MSNKDTTSLSIVVTGGAGFIGSHLTDELLQRGHYVTVLDNLRNGSLANLAESSAHPNFTFVEGDILDPETCLKTVERMDVVYHLACLGVRHSIHSPFENHRVNAEGTLRVLEAARQQAVKKFFYISTSEVYGGVRHFPIREEHVPRPFTVYGASKLAGEQYANAYRKCYGLEATILRIFNNYGPRAHYEGDAGELIPRAIARLLYDQQPILFGDGLVTRDFFYVKDTACVLSDLLGISGLNGITMNIGTGVEYTIRAVVEKIVTIMGKEHVGIQYEDARPADVPRLWVDNTLFSQKTRFRPTRSFEDGLHETIAYYENLAGERALFSGVGVANC
jgi:UDP-glucose 4-epimerase